MVRLVAMVICLFFLAVKNVNAQALQEHALAAAAGSVAAVGGKGVNDGIGKILAKVGKQAEQAARTGAPKADQGAAPRDRSVGAVPALGPLPAVSAAPRPRTIPPPSRPLLNEIGAVEPEAITFSETPSRAVEAPPAPPPLTPEDVARIEVGSTRGDLLARLGSPAFRISIPEDGGLLEIYSFHAGGRMIGKVRLTNGAVVGVQPAEP